MFAHEVVKKNAINVKKKMYFLEKYAHQLVKKILNDFQ